MLVGLRHVTPDSRVTRSHSKTLLVQVKKYDVEQYDPVKGEFAAVDYELLRINLNGVTKNNISNKVTENLSKLRSILKDVVGFKPRKDATSTNSYGLSIHRDKTSGGQFFIGVIGALACLLMFWFIVQDIVRDRSIYFPKLAGQLLGLAAIGLFTFLSFYQTWL